LAHGGYYPPYFQPPNSNAPPVGHPSAHNVNKISLFYSLSENQIIKLRQ
jgi:hypothetical protein